MHTRQLKAALAEFAEQAALRLQACVEAGQEVPFELDSHGGRRGAAALYCYRPLTGAYVAERFPLVRALPAYGPSAALLESFGGLDRYLVSRGLDPRRPGAFGRQGAALLALLQEAFGEQSDFHLQSTRLERALAALEGSALAAPSEVTLVATLHGLAISSPELRLTSGLALAQPHALEGAPEQALDAVSGEGLLVVHTTQDPDAAEAVAAGVEVLRDLLRALRLFGDGRLALGPQLWTRIASGPWTSSPLNAGGHPHGMLLVTPEQEDELRAFCNLVSRRAPREGRIAWALRRFELGCERPAEYEALSDHLLALRALLDGPREVEPDGSSSGLLAARLAALCATPEHRAALTERTLAAIALERAVISGTAVQHAGGLELVRALAVNLRALLRDLICGHLPAELVALADELLLSGGELAAGGLPAEGLSADELPAGSLLAEGLPAEGAAAGVPAEEMRGDAGQPGEVLDVAV